ncbi:Fc.00g101330.m01.CDS01 [Cosmosporella sp. VM-42]
MATATLITPSAHYQPQPSFSPGYQHQASGASIANMISSVEPRKPSDDESSNRQSLPSISEVISSVKTSGPYLQAFMNPREERAYKAPSSNNTQPGSSLPSPFAPTPRSHPETENHASPQTLHPATFPPRQDTLPAFSDSPRPPFSSRPPLPPVSDRRPSPPSMPDHPQRHMPEQQKPPEQPPTMNGVYAHPPPPPPAPVSYQPGQLPPGQMPLPAYPISPRPGVPPHVPGPYDHRPAPHVEADDYSARVRYDATVNRHFETWSYQDSLSRIGSSSRTIFNFAEAYSRIAQEQHGAHPIPERLPTEREVSDMLGNIELIKRSLEQVRDIVQASIQSERAREGAKMKGPFEEDHDVAMYGDGMKPQYGIAEVKKRRGRAAPPGRCHSCNRIDTPEWRRGPDGARTLCNACGLHYAKLERKRQLEARTIRPKPEEGLRP